MNKRNLTTSLIAGSAVFLSGLIYLNSKLGYNAGNLVGTSQDKKNTVRTASRSPQDDSSRGSQPRFVDYASPPPSIAPVIAETTPEPAQAKIVRGDATYTPKFYAGHSERLTVAPKQTVPVQLSWPNDTGHKDVFVQAVHGGSIDGGGNAKRFSLAKSKTISFTFAPAADPGLYEILLRRGTTEESLEFWVPTSNPQYDPPARK
jgi:hypothetical protein